MIPTSFKLANVNARSDDPEIGDLPILRTPNTCTSCWKTTVYERLCVLFTGRVYVTVLMNGGQPPMSLSIAEPVFGEPMPDRLKQTPR